ncbi:hypothetical protein BKA63DRAFT_573409 [Paraphoma chrysanthemicola]|nr:hypothetical protein BKA63DRAFT_573409 [Paraphoma chrysanthemicola]
MHFNTYLTAAVGLLTVAAAAPAAQPAALEIESSPASPLVERQSYFTLTSYLTGSCGTTRGYDVFYRNICSKLDFPAKSIRFQRSTLPAGCILFGYSDERCGGYNNLFVLGVTNSAQCYKTLPSATGEAQTTIRSVKLQC